MSSEARVRDDLSALIRRMVDSPEAVRVEPFEDRSRTVFEVSVAAVDFGKVIGRQGRTARALRTVLEARGELEGRRYGLEFFEG